MPLSKPSGLSALSLSLMLACGHPAMADGQAVIGVPVAEGSAPAPAAEKKAHVAAHNILAVDISDSMDGEEIRTMLGGIESYYMSNGAAVNHRGVCTANTVIYYGTSVSPMDTHIVCGEADARSFLDKSILSVDFEEMRGSVGPGTSAIRAIWEASKVFNAEERMNISAERRRLVFLTDERGGNPIVLSNASKALSRVFGASVHALVIGARSDRDNDSDFVVKAMRGTITTGAGITYKSRAYDFERRVPEGAAAIGRNAPQVAAHLAAMVLIGDS